MIRYGAIIEARMGSSRLPGKVTLKINNIPTILLLIDRLKQVRSINKVIVATTINNNNNQLCQLLKKYCYEYLCIKYFYCEFLWSLVEP